MRVVAAGILLIASIVPNGESAGCQGAVDQLVPPASAVVEIPSHQRLALDGCTWHTLLAPTRTEAAHNARYDLPLEEPCAVRALARQGWLTVPSEVVRVEPGARVALEVPDAPVGALGFSFRMVHGDPVVADVFVGTPAAEGGLVHGDRLEAVDGVPVRGVTDWDVVAAILGPPGTETTLHLRRGADDLVVERTFTRALLAGTPRSVYGH